MILKLKYEKIVVKINFVLYCVLYYLNTYELV